MPDDQTYTISFDGMVEWQKNDYLLCFLSIFPFVSFTGQDKQN
jgi:hypothetical protein